MPVIQELTAELEAYPANYVTLDVEGWIPGQVVNMNDELNFWLVVRNTGPITLNNVTIKVVGKNGAKVKKSNDPDFETSIYTATIDRVKAHNGEAPPETERMTLKAPARRKPAGTLLIEALIEDWDGDFEHMLYSHTRPSTTANGTWESQVYPA